MTDQLLGLARGGKYEIKPIDINVLARTSATMFGRTHKEIRIHDQSPDISNAASGSRILRPVRGWEQPSDHIPVFATFDL